MAASSSGTGSMAVDTPSVEEKARADALLLLLSRSDTLHDFVGGRSVLKKQDVLGILDKGDKGAPFQLSKDYKFDGKALEDWLKEFGHAKDVEGILNKSEAPLVNFKVPADYTPKNMARIANIKTFEPRTVMFYEMHEDVLRKGYPDRNINIGKNVSYDDLPGYSFVDGLYYRGGDPVADMNITKWKEANISYLNLGVKAKTEVGRLATGLYTAEISSRRTSLNEKIRAFFQYEGVETVYLVVDVSYVSPKDMGIDKDSLLIKLVCTVASDWDGAEKSACAPGPDKAKEISDEPDLLKKAAFGVQSIKLENSKAIIVGHRGEVKPDVNVHNATVQVSPLSACIANDGRGSACYNEQLNNRELFDIKRTGDALQAVITKNLNNVPGERNKYIFVTIDHLAFLKARINGVPSIFTSKDNKTDERLMFLYKPDVDALAPYNNLVSTFKRFEEVCKLANDKLGFLNRAASQATAAPMDAEGASAEAAGVDAEAPAVSPATGAQATMDAEGASSQAVAEAAAKAAAEAAKAAYDEIQKKTVLAVAAAAEAVRTRELDEAAAAGEATALTGYYVEKALDDAKAAAKAVAQATGVPYMASTMSSAIRSAFYFVRQAQNIARNMYSLLGLSATAAPAARGGQMMEGGADGNIFDDLFVDIDGKNTRYFMLDGVPLADLGKVEKATLSDATIVTSLLVKHYREKLKSDWKPSGPDEARTGRRPPFEGVKLDLFFETPEVKAFKRLNDNMTALFTKTDALINIIDTVFRQPVDVVKEFDERFYTNARRVRDWLPYTTYRILNHILYIEIIFRVKSLYENSTALVAMYTLKGKVEALKTDADSVKVKDALESHVQVNAGEYNKRIIEMNKYIAHFEFLKGGMVEILGIDLEDYDVIFKRIAETIGSGLYAKSLEGKSFVEKHTDVEGQVWQTAQTGEKTLKTMTESAKRQIKSRTAELSNRLVLGVANKILDTIMSFAKVKLNSMQFGSAIEKKFVEDLTEYLGKVKKLQTGGDLVEMEGGGCARVAKGRMQPARVENSIYRRPFKPTPPRISRQESSVDRAQDNRAIQLQTKRQPGTQQAWAPQDPDISESEQPLSSDPSEAEFPFATLHSKYFNDDMFSGEPLDKGDEDFYGKCIRKVLNNDGYLTYKVHAPDNTETTTVEEDEYIEGDPFDYGHLLYMFRPEPKLNEDQTDTCTPDQLEEENYAYHLDLLNEMEKNICLYPGLAALLGKPPIDDRSITAGSGASGSWVSSTLCSDTEYKFEYWCFAGHDFMFECNMAALGLGATEPAQPVLGEPLEATNVDKGDEMPGGGAIRPFRTMADYHAKYFKPYMRLYYNTGNT